VTGNSNAAPWQVIDKRNIYHSDWVGLEHWSVQLPDGSLIADHHVVIYPKSAVGVVACDHAGRFLLIDHYRFITDTRGWEIPAGRVEADETVAAAAARELLEETGHRAGVWSTLGLYHPSNGSSNQIFHVLVANQLESVADITDTNEVMACRWFDLDEVRGMIRRNEMQDGLSMTALLWAMLV
jgi:8-oxo-dGTP pyrophosphatase MutT (NUDIX family)